MNMQDYGSIKIVSHEMLKLLKMVTQLNAQVPICIIGEKGSGKMTLAQHIQKNILGDSKIPIHRNCQDSKALLQPGLLTFSEESWSDFLPKLSGLPFQLIEMPGLAQRKADLPQLAEFFLQVLSLMHNKPKIKLTEKALEKILQYSWPGQFAEFEAALEAAFLAAENGIIEPESLVLGPLKINVGVPIGMKLNELERKYILQTLYFVHQNRTKAAEILGISIRTLRNKINQYRVEGYL